MAKSNFTFIKNTNAMSKPSIGIIGGGLSGLVVAYYLKQNNHDATILEARDRLGGRIHTVYSDNEPPIELGATWLGKKHTNLTHLLSELKIDIHQQFMGKNAVYDPISTSPPQIVKMPYNPDPTYRIKGGSSQLIKTLASHLNNESILLNTKAIKIESSNNKIDVTTENEKLSFDKVLITLPPKLFLDNLIFEPKLPKDIVDIANHTHTWMSESIKVALTYTKPFWKDQKSIGSMFSNTGLISEMYDHSNYEDSKHALKGFINGGYAFATRDERIKRVIAQLTKYFGNQVKNYISYHEAIWRNEPYSHSDYDGFILPHQNNGHSIFQTILMNGNLYFGGSETASHYPGYMDGAVESGKSAADKIKKDLD